MALEKSKLLIEIEAKTGGTIGNFAKVTDGLSDIEDQTRATSKSTDDFSSDLTSTGKQSKKFINELMKMQNRYKSLANQIQNSGMDKANSDTMQMIVTNKSLNKTISKLSRSEKGLSSGIDEVSSQAQIATTNIFILNDALSKNNGFSNAAEKSFRSQANGLSKYGKIVDAVSGTIAAASRALSIFSSVIELLGDPQKAKKLVLILRFLSEILGLKGYGKMADGLDLIAGKIEKVSTEIVAFRDSVFTAFKIFSAFAKSEVIQIFFDTLEIAVAGLIATLGLSIGIGLFRGLDDLRVSLGLTDSVVVAFAKNIQSRFLSVHKSMVKPITDAGAQMIKSMATNSRIILNNTSNTLSLLTKSIMQFSAGFRHGFVDLGEIIQFSSGAEGKTIKRVKTFSTRFDAGLREGLEKSNKTFSVFEKQLANTTKSIDKIYVRLVENTRWMVHQLVRDSKKGLLDFVKPFQQNIPIIAKAFGKGLTDTIRISTKLMAGNLITLASVAKFTLRNILFSTGELSGMMTTNFSRTQKSFDLLNMLFRRSRRDIERILVDMGKAFGKMGILVFSPFVGGAAAALDDFIMRVKDFAGLSKKMMGGAVKAYAQGFDLIKESINDLTRAAPKSFAAFSTSMAKNMLVPIDELGKRNVVLNSVKKSLLGMTQILKGFTRTMSATVLALVPFGDLLGLSSVAALRNFAVVTNLVQSYRAFSIATTNAAMNLATVELFFGTAGRAAFVFGTAVGDVAAVAFPLFIGQVKRIGFDLKLLSSIFKDLLSASIFAIGKISKDTATVMKASFDSGARSGMTMRAIIEASFRSMGNTIKEFGKTSIDAMVRLKNAVMPAISSMATSMSLGMVKMVQITKSGFDGMITATIEGAKHFKAFAMGFGRGFLEPSKLFAQGMVKMKNSVMGFGSTVAKVATPSMLGLVEAGTAVAPIILSLSTMFLNSDSSLVKFAATIGLVASLMLTTFATAVTVLASHIGSLLISMGDKLLGAMDKMSEKFIKVQKSAALTKTVIEGFGRALGVDVVGSVQRWNTVMDGAAETTLFAASSISKGLKVLIAEGASLGLSANQVEQFFNRATDVAEGSAKEFEDVTGRFAAALTGSTQGLANMGIMVNESAINHSKYSKALGKTASQMSETEIVQARFNVTMENTIPFIGSALAATETISGANALYAKSIDMLQTKLGSMNDFTVVYTQTITAFVRSLTNLPTAFIDIISISIDFLGVSLKIIGTIVKYGIVIFTLKTLYGFAAAAVLRFGVVQSGLSIILNLVNTKLGLQAVAIKTISGLWVALAAIIKAAVVQGFMGLIVMLEAALLKTLAFSGAVLKSIFSLKFWGAAMGKVALAIKFMAVSILKATLAIRANPLLMTAAIVITGLVLVGKAIADISEDFKKMSGSVDENAKTMKKAGEETGQLRKMMTGLKNILSSIGTFIMSVTKLIVTGLLLAFLKTINIMFKMAKAVGGLGISQKKLANGIENSNKAIEEAEQLALKYGVSALSSFDETAEAAERAESKVADLKKMHEDLAKVVTALGKGGSSALEGQASVISSLGTEYAAMVKTVEIANAKVKALADTAIKLKTPDGKKFTRPFRDLAFFAERAADGNKELQKVLSSADPKKIGEIALKLKEATKEARNAALSLEKLNRETFFGFSEIQKSLRIENSLLTAAITKDAETRKSATLESISVEGKARIKAFNASVEGLRKINKERRGSALFTKVEAKLIRSTRKEILANTAALLQQAGIRIASEKQEKELGILEDSLSLIVQTLKVEQQVANLTGDKVRMAEAELSVKLAGISAKQRDLDLTTMEGAALHRKLETLKRITKEQGGEKIAEAKPLNLRNLLGGGDISQFMVDAVGDMADALGNISLEGIGDGLKDAGKSFAQFFKDIPSSMSGIGKSLLNSGKGFVDSMKNITLEGTVDSLKTGFKSAANFIMDIDLGAIGDGIKAAFEFGSSIVSGIATVFNPANIVAAGEGLTAAFTEIPQAISAALQELPAIMTKFAENFGEILTKLLSSLPEIINAVLEALPQVVQAILDGIVMIIDSLPAIVQGIIAKVPEILSQLLAAIPTIITSLLEAIPQIITMLMAQIPTIFIQLVKAVPAIVEALISGLIGAAAEIAVGFIDTFIVKGGAIKMAIGLVTAIINLIPSIVKGIAGGLKRAFGSIFGGVKIPAAAIDTDKLKKNLDDAMNTVSKKASEASESLFSIIDLDAVGGKKKSDKDGGGGGVSANLIGDTKKSVSIWEKFWKGTLKLINFLFIKPFLWIWNNVFLPIVKLVSDAFSVAFKIFDDLAELVQDAFGGILTLFDNLTGTVDKAFGWILKMTEGWPNIFKEPFIFAQTIFQAITGGMRAVFTFFRDMIPAIVNYLKAPFVFLQEVGASLTKLFTDPIQALKEIGASTAKLLMSPFQLFKDSIKPLRELFSKFTDGFKKIFQGVGDLITAPFKDIANLIDFSDLGKKFKALILAPFKAISKVIDFSDLGKKFKDIIMAPWRAIGNVMSKLFKIDFKGTGKVENAVGIDIPFVNFAMGGTAGGDVPGNATVSGDSELNDKVLALLSPGEKIVPRSALRDPNVSRVVDAIIKSGKLPKFGFGGTLGKALKGDVKGVVSDTKKAGSKLNPAKLFEQSKAMIEDKATGFLMDMLEANALSSGGTVQAVPLPSFGASDFQLGRPQPSETINFGSGGASGFGGGSGGSSVVKNFTVKIEEGAIQITSEGNDSEEIAAEIFEQIKRRSADGEFIFSSEGGRDTA